MSGKKSSDGSVGGFLFAVFALIVIVPKPVWIALGVLVAVTVTVWIFYKTADAAEKRHAEAQERERVERAERAAAAKREREERARRDRQRRIDTLGKENAALLEFALSAVKRVVASEAARAGWLGDVDFGADITGITDRFEKAHALRAVTGRLSALDKPSAEDRKILAEATTTAANLEHAAIERVELIGKCATEAQRHALRDRGDAGHHSRGFGGGCGDGTRAGLPGDQEPDRPSPGATGRDIRLVSAAAMPSRVSGGV